MDESVNSVDYSLGAVFKRIRESVFGVPLLEIATLMNISTTSYNRFEKDNFGKNFESKKNVTLKFWAEKFSSIIFEEAERKCVKLNEKLKEVLIQMFKDSSHFDEDKLFYLSKYDQSNPNSLENFIYNIFLIFSGETNVNISDSDSINTHIKTQDLFRYKNSILGKIVNFKELKNCVIKVVDVLKPKDILEIGFGTGLVVSLISQLFPKIRITAIDSRKEMKPIAEENADKNSNIEFITSGYEYLDSIDHLPELTLMVYSFHHIEDPLKNKLDMLKNLKSKMGYRSKICIADIFLPEACSYSVEVAETRRFWDNRIMETYCNTFWTAFDGVESDNVLFAREVAKKALNNELMAADAVLNRKDEYLIKMSELLKIAEKAGFDILASEYCNSLGDGIVILG